MMGKHVMLARRQFLRRSAFGVAACVGMDVCSAISANAVAATGDDRHYQPISDRLPPKPRERPLDWRKMADDFSAYIMRPANGIFIQRSDGKPCFASATESSGDGGLTTFGPVALGKALRGEDVSELLPSLDAYFNESSGIFLDDPGADSCEYWYLMNVNALAAGLIRKTRPRDELCLRRLRRSAECLIKMAHQLNYDFNAQGYSFARSSPWTDKDIYRQPDGVAGYAYLMLFAYDLFGDPEFLGEARTGITRYLAFQKNPWYEIPMGAMGCLAAARLSTHYHQSQVDFRKALAFVLDPDIDCLRTGEWGGKEVNGLMGGWGMEPPGQAYSMESMVVLPYVLPALRYHPEYASDIGRYVLNVAANMRLFYCDYLAPELQSKPGFAPAVPYERLSKELKGHTPYAAGDYDGHRSVYGGAYALWLGELIHPTEDPFVLQCDLSASDFLAKATYPSFLYYNPWQQERKVSLGLQPGTWDVYDIGEHRFVTRRQQASVHLTIPLSGSRVVAVIPAGEKQSTAKGVLSAGEVPVDYHVEE